MNHKKEKKSIYLCTRVKPSFKNEFIDFCDKNEYNPSQIVRDLVKKYMEDKVKFLK